MTAGIAAVQAAVRLERVLEDLKALDRFSIGTGPGITRLAYSPEENAARRWIAAQLESFGLRPAVDAAGNLLAVTGGPAAGPPVLSGSHLDSVPNGGRFDGALGAVCALEVLRALRDSGVRTRLPVGTLITAPEESSRFGVGCLGSRLLSGKLTAQMLSELRDGGGVSVLEAMAECGLDPAALDSVRRPQGWCSAFLELHVDQGPSLREAGAPAGNVTAIVVPSKVRVTFTGEASHAGATPWHLRRDALVGASALIQEVAGWNRSFQHDGTVATVGKVHVEPGAVNVVPGRVTVWLDLRPVSRARRTELIAAVEDRVAAIAAAHRLEGAVEVLVSGDPVECSTRLMAAIDTAASAAGLPCPRLPSMAGHDAAQLADITEVGMIFVRNLNGISHSPHELAEPGDIEAGCRILAGALVHAAGLMHEH